MNGSGPPAAAQGGEPQQAEPHLFVIVGATGDLNERKLLPAVYRLIRGGHLDDRSRILGVARSTEMDDRSFRRWARRALADDGVSEQELAGWCDDCLSYVGVGRGEAEDYERLRAKVEQVERQAALPGKRIVYLALPPSAFGATVEAFGRAGLHRPPESAGDDGWVRLVIEKPFGYDLASAQALNRTVHRWFDESCVYRIDHYLGKETVQNLLVFRFSNVVFESLWNRERIDNVQITVAEENGVEGRGAYYDRAGALRDMVQNHVTQVLSLVAMEVPVAYEADAVRREKIKALRSVQRLDGGRDVVLGQYEGYAGEADLDGPSTTETYAALRLSLDSWRWQGVPFLLRTGKRLARRVTEIAVVFRRPPVALFESMHCEPDVESNVLLIRLQPDEGFALRFGLKVPGEPLALDARQLVFSYADAFGGPLADAYETLLLDVMTGDQTLFVHAEEVEASWRLYAPLLDPDREPHRYAQGSWGPEAAGRLLPPGASWKTR